VPRFRQGLGSADTITTFDCWDLRPTGKPKHCNNYQFLPLIRLITLLDKSR